jgi:hypothetical protein
MAWYPKSLGAERCGQASTYSNAWLLSNTALAAGTVDLVAQLGLPADVAGNPKNQWTLISLICDAATAGSAIFNTASTDAKRKIALAINDNTRKAENSAYWYAKVGEGLNMTTDVVLNDVQLLIGLI